MIDAKFDPTLTINADVVEGQQRIIIVGYAKCEDSKYILMET